MSEDPPEAKKQKTIAELAEENKKLREENKKEREEKEKAIAIAAAEREKHKIERGEAIVKLAGRFKWTGEMCQYTSVVSPIAHSHHLIPLLVCLFVFKILLQLKIIFIERIVNP